ncbi:hypothetical protein TRAPUB_13965 [Trametes pubescens]|uniref:glucan 1,3-beta-glucosidase n=1 Tax=Trametes pubescens TaxID=154538 RepID=A0A1M2VPU9_TRAPU|nr:hypothetical protein TRAPUB_13965 [Trametes pubescens]
MSSGNYQPVSNGHSSSPNLDAGNDHEDARNTQFYSPEMEPLDLPRTNLPASAAPPHFMGTARHEENRSLYASSKGSKPTMVGFNNSSDKLNAQNSCSDFYGTDYNNSQPMVALDGHSPEHLPYQDEKHDAYQPKLTKSRQKIIIVALIALAITAVTVVVPVSFAVIRPKQNNTSNDLASGTAASNSSDSSLSDSGSTSSMTQSRVITSSGDGSTVTFFDSSKVTYSNSFSRTWYYNPANPTVSGAWPQSWTPALNKTFNYGVDPIWGVNLGGWLVMEPFIVPALYEKYYNTSGGPAVDEWDLTMLMNADGSINKLKDHYKMFITEQDFADIAAAGLNFVRILIAYWAIEVCENKLFLPKTSWTYFLKAIKWARKYGLRINLDLHVLPGSQNGWNHSSKLGTINILLGPMSIANVEQALDYIHIIAKFISQPEYRDIIPLFGIMNEPFSPTIGSDAVEHFYLHAYEIVRKASGMGEGKGPWVIFHDVFLSLSHWMSFLQNTDRMQLDVHQYICFNGQSADNYTARVKADLACDTWGTGVRVLDGLRNNSMSSFGMTHISEWSLGINDCGLWLNGVDLSARYNGTFMLGNYPKVGDCSEYTDYMQYDDTWKVSMKQFALQSMSALQNWFFWTWKVSNSTVSGHPQSPAWSYQLGLQEGWMPTDPCNSEGACDNSNPFTGTLSAWMTASASAGKIAATVQAALAWPPMSISSVKDTAMIPQYMQTGTLIQLPAPTVTAVSGSAMSMVSASSWNNPSDTTSLWVPIALCGYLNSWMGLTASPDACPTTSVAARRAYAPQAYATPAPVPTS